MRRVVVVVVLLLLVGAVPALEMACDGDGDDPRHVHACPALASTHDVLAWLALIVPAPDAEPLGHPSSAHRPPFVPPRR